MQRPRAREALPGWLLAPLGVSDAQVDTLDAWALALARRVFEDPKIRLCPDPPALVTSLKRPPALFHALHERFARLDPKHATLRRLRKRLAPLFTDRTFLEGAVAASPRCWG